MTRSSYKRRLRAAYSEALTALRMGRAASAERQLRAIQAAAPGDVNSLRLLGVALLDQDKVADALETLERAVGSCAAILGRAHRSGARLPPGRPARSGTRGAQAGRARRRR